MEIKAVLFDCDGLMFETERVSQLIWKYEAESNGIQLPDDFFAHVTGSGGRDLQDYLDSIPNLSEIIDKIKEKRFDLAFWSSINQDCLNKVGLINLFHYLEEKGYKVAICSSSHREYVLSLLKTVSVRLKYDAIIGGDMTRHAKPDPEIFLKGAEAVGVMPEHCLVLEDSKLGLKAAKAAGMHSCFIEDTIKKDEEMMQYIEFEKTDLNTVIDLLEEIKLLDTY